MADMTKTLGPAEVSRKVTEALTAHDVDAGLALVDPDAIDHSAPPGTPPGLGGWRQKWEEMIGAFPDLAFAYEQSVEEGDTVANRYTMSGTQASQFMGIPSGGRRFEVMVLDMVRVRDGKVIEHWALVDQASMKEQLT
jgi:predicted ester cyclase